MTLGFALVVFVVIALITRWANKKGLSVFFGILSIITFIAFLKTGLGFDILDWGNDPSVDVPDNIHVPGQ